MSLPEFDISGQKVLVAGVGRGIGKGVTLAFVGAGADVAITGCHHRPDLGSGRRR